MTVLEKSPRWLNKKLVTDGSSGLTRSLIAEFGINTVCASSRCPNQNECFSSGQATFLLLGNVCTRNCAFCSVDKGIPGALDSAEPQKIADAAKKLGLKYVVITSVTRDDIPDGGASQFAKTVVAVKCAVKTAKTEVLVPDFQGRENSIERVLSSRPEVFGHNIETVESLYRVARQKADYRRSLEVLRLAKAINKHQVTKSSIMVGLGEKSEDLFKAMEDLTAVGCDILTIGQYLRPTPRNLPVARYIRPNEFAAYKTKALKLGFKQVLAGPFVRSSYLAEEVFKGGSDDRS